MRYVIKFTKESEIKFVSHLDLMRTIQRVVRRAALPVEYSKGFNPHMTLSLAQPLSVGVYSEGEYLDIILTEELDDTYIKERLNEKAPQGIRFLEVVRVKAEGDKKIPQTMALIEAAAYEIKIKYEDTQNLDSELRELLTQKQWVALKKSKSGEKMVDIRPMVMKFETSVDNGLLKINTLVACGSRENLSPELLSSYIKSNTSGAKNDAFVEIKRKELYAGEGGTLLPISEFVARD